MEPREALSIDQIQLGDPAFRMHPPDVREGAFQMLRRERPISFHEEFYTVARPCLARRSRTGRIPFVSVAVDRR